MSFYSKSSVSLLLAYFLLGMTFIMETSGGSGLAYSFNVLAWLTICLFISLALFKVNNEKQVTISSFDKYMLLALFCFAIPFLFDSPFSDFAIPRYLGLVLAVLFFYSLNQFSVWRENPHYLLYLILLAVNIQATVGLFQLSLNDYYAPLNFDPATLRTYGLFYQPNVMASFMATGLAVAVYIVASTKNISTVLWAYLLVTIIVTTTLVATLKSLTGFYGAALALFFISPYFTKRFPKRFLFIAFLITSTVLTSQHIQQTNATFQLEKNYTNSVDVRKTLYNVGIKLWLASPIKGTGYGHFERHYLDFHNQLKKENPALASPIKNLDHPHNEILYWAIEGGLAPIIGISLIVFFFSKSLFNSKQKLVAMSALGLLIPIAFHTQTERPFYSSVAHLIVFIMLAAHFYYVVENSLKKCRVTWTFALKTAAIINALISISFLMTTLHTNHVVTKYEKSAVKTVDKLATIINPLPWRQRIESHVFNNIFYSGVQKQDREKIKQYVIWAEKQLLRSPRESIYQRLLASYKLLGQTKEYQQTLAQAKATYPLKSEWPK